MGRHKKQEDKFHRKLFDLYFFLNIFLLPVYPLEYDLKLPSVVATKPVQWKSIIHIDGFDSDGEDLLTRLLCLNPKQRIKVEDGLKHSFFKPLLEQEKITQTNFQDDQEIKQQKLQEN